MHIKFRYSFRSPMNTEYTVTIYNSFYMTSQFYNISILTALRSKSMSSRILAVCQRFHYSNIYNSLQRLYRVGPTKLQNKVNGH